MELDNIKNLWKEEKVPETPEISTENQNRISTPLEKIKRNLKMEFWSMLPVFPLVIFLLYNTVKNERLLMYSVSLIVVAMMVCTFYTVKIYRFYKNISTHSLSSYQHLLELDYQLKYYIDIYQSYYISFVPILLCEIFLLFQFGNQQDVDIISFTGTLILNLLIAFILLYGIWWLWFSFFYGRHLKSIKKIIKNINSL